VSGGRGRLIADGEHATIVFERTLHHAIEHVWEAITSADDLKEWRFVTSATIDARVGGTIETVSGPAQYRSTGKILRWEPPRVFEYEWKVAPVPEMPHGEDAVFLYELEPLDGATRLTVTYRRITRNTARGFLPGTHVLLDRLEAQLDGAPLPDWQERFAALRAEYPEWKS
jgi:uncharacterized protein YndB with AHSA1/START domain